MLFKRMVYLIRTGVSHFRVTLKIADQCEVFDNSVGVVVELESRIRGVALRIIEQVSADGITYNIQHECVPVR